MILGFDRNDIVKKAVSCQSQMTDGVVQYNYETGKLFGASFTTGTVENPANPFIEVFRLRQGEIECYDCNDCPYDDEEFINKMKTESPDLYTSKEECCRDAYVDELLESFYDDFEDNFKEGVERQVRDLLDGHLSDILNKLNSIRISISDIATPYKYLEVRQDDWEMRVLDSYIDDAMDNGFDLSVEPSDYVDAEIQYLIGICEHSEFPTLQRVAKLIADNKFDDALEVLQ